MFSMTTVLVVTLLCSICSVTVTQAAEAEDNEKLENSDGTTTLKFACSQQCQKGVLFDVNCNNGEMTVTKLNQSFGGWIDKLQDKITKLSSLFDSSNIGSGNFKAADIISSIEDQISSLEDKVDRLIENLGVETQ